MIDFIAIGFAILGGGFLTIAVWGLWTLDWAIKDQQEAINGIRREESKMLRESTEIRRRNEP